MAEQYVARASGVGLIERSGKLYAVELGTAWAYTMGFVLGLVTFLLATLGVVQLVLAMTGSRGMALLGAILVAAAVVLGMGLWLVVRFVRKRHTASLDSLPVIVVFDFGSGQLLGPTGQPLAPLSQVQLHFQFQLGSSSRALALRWPGGSLVLVRANPFAGGSAAIESALHSRGISAG